MATDPSDGLQALADTLWEERQLAELLLYKLVSARLILAADDRRHVGLALVEVERVIQAFRGAEAQRSRTVERIADDLDVPPGELRLAVLAEEAPEPWRTVFGDHRERFLALTTEIEEAAMENRRLLSAALNGIHESLSELTIGEVGTTYTAAGRQDAATTRPTHLDQAL